MAISLDAATWNASSSSFSHTVGNSGVAGLLVVGVKSSGQTTGTTYMGLAMTKQIEVQVGATGEYVALYYLKNPPRGAHTVAHSGASSYTSVASSYFGVDQTNPIDASGSTNTGAQSSTISKSITTVADNTWLIAFMRNDTAVANANGGSAQTRRGGTASSIALFDSNGALTPAGSKTASFVTADSSNADWGLVVMSLTPAGATDLKTNLISYYKFDSSNSNDSVGSNNGTDTSITYSSGNGKIGVGAGFNGSSSKIQLDSGGDSVLCPSAGDFSFSAWVKLGATGATQAIMGRVDQSSFRITSGNKISLLQEDPGRGNYTVTGGTSLTTSTWYHVVAVMTAGSKMEVFLNGTSDGTFTTSIPTTYFNPTQKFELGVLDNSPDTGFLNGAIDEVAVWNRALTSSEVTQLYNSGAGLQYPFTTAAGFDALNLGHFA